MGADIGALVGEEDVVEGEDEAARVDRGADAVDLVARVVGGDEVLAAVLDPLHRPAEPERAERHEHILGVDLAADAEAAADMALVEVELFERQVEERREALPVDVRDLRRAVNLEDAGVGIEAGDGAARLQRRRRCAGRW